MIKGGGFIHRMVTINDISIKSKNMNIMTM